MRGVLLTAVLSVAVTACTAGFIYDRLHWVVSWYVNGLVSLDDAQEQQLRDIVSRTMVWHRETQLPRYVALLDALDHDKDKTVTVALFESRYQEMVVLFDAFLRHVLPDAASLLRTLSPAQVDELAENLEEDNQDLWDEYAGATTEQRAKRRVKNATRILQRFTGNLTREQRALVETRLVTMHDVSEQWMERRRLWQQKFVEVLRNPPPGAGFEAALGELMLNPNQFDAPGYRQSVEDNRQTTMAMLVDLTNSLDSRQRTHLGRKFREYAQDMRDIMSGS